MPLTTDDLVQLSAVGISTAEQLIEVARIIDRHVTRHADDRDAERDARAKALAAERSKKYRNRNKINAGSEGCDPPARPEIVTPSSRSMDRDASRSAVLVSPAPLPPSSSKTLEIKDEKKGKVSQNARGSRLPDDFVPNETCERIARELNFTNRDWRECLDEFRDYWKGVPGSRGVKSDWQATFRNAIRSFKRRNGNGKATPIRGNSLDDAFAVVNAAIAKRRNGSGETKPDVTQGSFDISGLWQGDPASGGRALGISRQSRSGDGAEDVKPS